MWWGGRWWWQGGQFAMKDEDEADYSIFSIRPKRNTREEKK